MIRRALVLAGALALASHAPAAADTFALTGATVHTVSGATIENGTIVVTNGKIAAVGADVAIPAGARTVSAAGKHIYPGLIAANTVLGLTEISSVAGTNDWQEVGDVNPNVRAEVQINPESDIIPVTRVNGITSALVMPRGGAVAGTSAMIHLAGWTWEDMTVRAPIGLHVNWPSMTPNRAWWETRSVEEQAKARDQAIENIRKVFEDARAYWKARDAEGQAGVPRHDRDVKWEAMRKALSGEIPVLFHASALNQIHAALRFAEEQKLPKVILVGADDAWRVTDELRARNIAVIAGGMLEMPRHGYDPYDDAFTLPARLHSAGIRFCISDGGGAGAAANARNLPYHAAMAAAFGLPRDEALKAITLFPAQILGVADKIGSIEVGKNADLVVASGDPLEITTKVEQVYIDGEAISMQTRHTRLFAKYDSKPRGPKAKKR